ncbi:LysE family translocator [Teichococcus cervicalis]|uniref:Translocator protein, LysE family n=1 Tax=Pseudoroseomonas cervicalis ATCC 49957 TaxID=525371 RepID=D5RHS7_9PROT|nr:LysE family translocator [Pseudoroseomonas cervicalis]EFH13139.1 translocator protein, LysE family [Pseudoroseomonas cervicalis ATCC 49957]WBV43801.1 LysE family translocator [Pseudoroseomonas cervicalis]
MPIENWLAFTAAAAILLAIPGPTILLVISYALGHGRRPAAAMVAGVALGDLTAMTASMAGLGALLATSSELFTLLRWVGAAYLVYLGLKLWRAPVQEAGAAAPSAGLGRIFGHAYAVTALNPKSIVFFVAFVPQFLAAGAPFLPQVGVMIATFVSMAAANAALYALLAASARGALRRPAVQRAVNRTGGGLLMGAGLLSVLWRKAPA